MISLRDVVFDPSGPNLLAYRADLDVAFDW